MPASRARVFGLGRWASGLGALLGGLAWAQVAAAQLEMPDPEAATLAGRGPFATLTANPFSPRPRREAYGLYVYSTTPTSQGGAPLVAVRRVVRTLQGETVDWAASPTCAGLTDVVVALESLRFPSINVPGLGRETNLAPNNDGVIYTLRAHWADWGGAGIASEAEVTTNLGTPVAEWASRFVSTLRACWSKEAPEASSR